MNDRNLIQFLRLLPKSTLSRAVGGLSRLPVPLGAQQAVIQAFVRRYQIDAAEAGRPMEEYRSLGEFFTRRLRPGARPIAEGETVVVSPVDARVASFGCSTSGRMIQCKGRDYSLAALLNDPLDGRDFEGGCYCTLYLSPRDYHRIHAPLGGIVEGYAYVPGKLFPVNQPSVREVPNLFCVNERLITYLRTSVGRVAVVKVGATCVGRIRASYDDVVTQCGGAPVRRRYPRPISIAKGEEVGVFELGSTVILLFEPGRVAFDPCIAEGATVRVGQAIAQAASGTQAGRLA